MALYGCGNYFLVEVLWGDGQVRVGEEGKGVGCLSDIRTG